MGEVMERLQAVKAGTVPFSTVVAEFRERPWESPARDESDDAVMRRGFDDIDPVETPLSEVASAYYQDVITAEQYRALYHVIHTGGKVTAGAAAPAEGVPAAEVPVTEETVEEKPNGGPAVVVEDEKDKPPFE